MTGITNLHLGHVRYDEGRPPLAWGNNRFERSALVARVTADDGTQGSALAWCRVPDGAAFARAAVALNAAGSRTEPP